MGIILDLEDGFILLVKGLEYGKPLFCVDVHGAKPPHADRPPVFSHTKLFEDDETSGSSTFIAMATSRKSHENSAITSNEKNTSKRALRGFVG